MMYEISDIDDDSDEIDNGDDDNDEVRFINVPLKIL